MKRILLITENIGSGGAERQLCGLAVFLTEKGYPCRLITYKKNQFFEPYLREYNVEYEFVPELFNKYTRVIRLVKYIKAYNPDVVISFLSHVNVYVCLARLFCKFKLIVSERNNNICLTNSDKIQFNLYRKADYVVPNSHSQVEFIKKNFPFLNNKVKPIINYVSITKFVPDNDKIDNKICRIITAARVMPQKNCLLYLDAVKIIKDRGLKVRFDWFGNIKADKRYVDAIMNKIADLEISDYITFHDASNEIVYEYQHSDVFCLPSTYEGYPNVIIEAMCCELPIICSNIFDNKYIVQDGINGFLFDPNNPHSIANAVEKMLNLSLYERKRIGKRNKLECLERNSEQKFIQNYVDLVESNY